jgi:hypothetical protein
LTLPVEVVMAEVKSQLLNDCLGKLTVVVGHIEVSGEDAGLCNSLWEYVEVVFRMILLALHDHGIDQAS